MPKESGSEKPKSSAQERVVRKHMEYQASLESIQKGKTRRRQREKNIAEEKRQAEPDLMRLRFKMALPSGSKDILSPKKPGDFGTPEDKTVCLNADEKKAYEDTIREFMKEEGTEESDKELLRVTIMEFIFDPLAFREHYVRWKTDYTNNPRLKVEFSTPEAYVVDRSKAFVQARRNEIVAARMRLFQTTSVDALLEPSTEKVFIFLDLHRDELLEYSALSPDDPQRQIDGALFKLFLSETLLGSSDQKQKELAFQFFQDVVGDFGAAVTAEKKLENAGSVMIGKIQYAIDNNIDVEGEEWREEWNTLLQEKENQYLKEKPAEQKSFQIYQPSGTSETLPRDTVLDSPQRAALYAGLYYEGENGDGTHTVKFLDSDLRTTMRIQKRSNSLNYDDAEFVFTDPYADKSRGNQIVLHKENLRAGCNQMYLDYIMNDWIRVNKLSPNIDVNSILDDSTLQEMAERFFGKKLNEITLTPEKRAWFQRFLQVLMNGDPSTTPDKLDESYPTFTERVKVMSRVLSSETYAGVVQKECEKDSVTLFTVSTLLKKIGYEE